MQVYPKAPKVLPLLPCNWEKLPHEPSVFGLMLAHKFIDLTVGHKTTFGVVFDETKVLLEDYDPTDYAVPWMRVTKNGRVIGHNGRHRAAMCLKAGHLYFPMVMMFQAYSSKSKTYRTIQANKVPREMIGQFIPQVRFATHDIFTPLQWF